MDGVDSPAKKKIVIAIEKKGNGVSRVYARVIKSASRKNVENFLNDFISKEARIKAISRPGHLHLGKCSYLKVICLLVQILRKLHLLQVSLIQILLK